MNANLITRHQRRASVVSHPPMTARTTKSFLQSQDLALLQTIFLIQSFTLMVSSKRSSVLIQRLQFSILSMPSRTTRKISNSTQLREARLAHSTLSASLGDSCKYHHLLDLPEAHLSQFLASASALIRTRIAESTSIMYNRTLTSAQLLKLLIMALSHVKRSPRRYPTQMNSN